MKKDNRAHKAKLNIVTSLGGQVITLICGLVVPRLMLSAFGSEAYGLTSSITQFLAYITLLEGGIGGVARAVLYKPLSQNDMETIGDIMAEIRRFFRFIAMIFAGYVLVLASTFQMISDVEIFDWLSTFLLVIVISISTFGQYFIGISNAILLQAAQKTYITNVISIGATVINAFSTIVFVELGCSLTLVKLASSCIFFMRPVVMWLYVSKHYQIPKTGKTQQKQTYLTQKWSGLSQHIAFFLHSNTDVVILTILSSLRAVAVYSVYNMIISHVQSLALSFTSGMEAVFGDMMAKEEYEKLHKTFSTYETIISVVSVVLFSTTIVMILPFITLYTAGILDTNYHEPIFAVVMVLASLCYCLRMPYHALVIAAGHFKQSCPAAYGEAILNILLSVLLVSKHGMTGVAAGTLVATCFRFAYYVYYLSKHIFYRKIQYFVKRFLINVLAIVCSCVVGLWFGTCLNLNSYLRWMICGIFVTVFSGLITVGMNVVFYHDNLRSSFRMVLKK